nr:biotin carboxylase N-terminal domain-containing protein [Actibacterium sp. 188UL27-1]
MLIANRGEIACRIMRTAQAMGLRCVAVYSEADAGAMHVAMADQAVCIGGPAPADSYLRGDAIIAAAQATGAQAVHPGYGFLSENPDFVEACDAAGLIFVGPSAAAIRAMGLKDAAKARMVAAGVPVVPGYHGADQGDDLLAAEAAGIGYPVIIKAVAGGGGKGMRIVDGAAGFAEALASARAEALAAFGNADVLVEKYIQQPRHIEMQVFGDAHGNVVHLYERDCSLQRRHQKVIEEAPAPGMTAEVRAAMGQAAVRAAEAIGYQGAGTIEFIVDGAGGLRPDGFWFMEMNTRLQVEHPVTEAITGVDLVGWQLRVAAGEPLPLAQDDIPLRGHAFEARLYAEDVPAGFLPATGRLDHLQFPGGVRADTGVRSGDVISPWYDPMIAKVIVEGPDRAVALRRLCQGLAGTQVAGLVTNLGFLGRLARQGGFAAGDVDTGLIGREITALSVAVDPAQTTIAAAALALTGLDRAAGWDLGFTLWEAPWRRVDLGIEAEVAVRILAPDHFEIRVGDAMVEARRGVGGWALDGAAMPAACVTDRQVTVFGAETHVFAIPDPLAPVEDSAIGAGLTVAPMPGLVRDVAVAVGAHVAAGDRLAVLEAMKMEHVLRAARDGTVSEILVGAGDQVEAGTPLVRLAEEDAA